MINTNTAKDTKFSGMDAGIKLIITLFLAIIPFFCIKPLSFAALILFFLQASALSGIKIPALLKNVVAYLIIIILPLVFGIAVQALIGLISENASATAYSYHDLTLRVIRLFFLWYVTSLYIMTTPVEPFLGLLDKILTPLKLLRVPVSSFLNTLRFVMAVLGDMGARFISSYKELLSSYQNKSKKGFSKLMKDIVKVLVSLITESLADTEKVQNMIETESDRGYSYTFKVNKSDLFAVFLLIVLLAFLAWFELF